MKRDIEPLLASMLNDDRKEVIIIEGARQTGKSYLVNSVLSNIKKPSLSFDLEKEDRIRRQIDATEDFDDFLSLMNDQYDLKDYDILFFDEAQECRRLARYIKSFKEDLTDKKVILTGSSMNRLFSKDERIPVGRTRSLCVHSFNFSEFLRYCGHEDLADFIKSAPQDISASRHNFLLEQYDKYLTVGGYPEAVKAYTGGYSYTEVIDEIMAGLAEDFARKEAYQPGLFSGAVNGIANHIGSPSKYTHVDASKYHVKNVIEAMKLWHIVIEVQAHSMAPHRSNFLPKRYLHDIGVVNRRRALAAPLISIIDTLDPALRTPLGGLFENAVLLNLLEGGPAFKQITTWKGEGSNNIEVDFIMELPGQNSKIPVECKAAKKIKSSHYNNIIHYLEFTKQKRGILISAAPLEKISAAGGRSIVNVPVYLAVGKNLEGYV